MLAGWRLYGERRTRYVQFTECSAAKRGLQPGQKRGCRHAQCHVAVPTVPGSGFAMIQAKLPLGTLKALFDSPAQPGGAGQFRQRCSSVREDQIVGALCGIALNSTDQQPAFEAGVGRPRQFDPYPVIQA
jgi:hypothetical protein